MEREEFAALVRQAIEELPEEFRRRLENIEVVVEDWPPAGLARSLGHPPHQLILGFYRGVPLPARGSGYQLVLPDRITIYQQAIEAISRSRAEVRRKVQEVVWHEIAHFFGLGDQKLEELSRREKQ